MPDILTEVEEHASQERSVSEPSNPMAQHAYEGFAKRQRNSRPGSGLFLGAGAAALVLVLAAISGLWLVRSVRRLNGQVARLNRQTQLLDKRVQAAEQQATASAQQASQAAADAQAAALQRDQTKDSTAAPATPAAQSATAGQPGAQKQAAQAQPTAEPTAAAAKGAHPASQKAESRNSREDRLQKLQQSLGQIAETRPTPNGLVMTLGEKSIRFDSGRADVAPQYRAILSRIAGVLKPLKGYSIYVYGYTDDNGTKDFNVTLSARRAGAVRDSLVKAGVDRSLISTKGLGNSKPLVRGTSAKARAANHRIEIGITELATTTAQLTSVSKAGARP